MAIAMKAPNIYFFAIEMQTEYIYSNEKSTFGTWSVTIEHLNLVASRYAGIGFRGLGQEGEEAILNLYGKNQNTVRGRDLTEVSMTSLVA